MKAKLFSILLLSSVMGTDAFADVTLQFSQISVGRATGFANNAGVATNGMRWGIVVSTSNAGFNAGTYDVFDNTVAGFLSVGGLLTDDYFVPSTVTTSALGATGGDPGGDGGITTLNPVPFGGATGITDPDPFQLIWFESTPANNSYYGMMSNGLFVIPTNGTGTSFASTVFGGGTADPIKPANLQFTAIPEPSRMMLLGFGLVGLFFRRRR